MTGRRVALFAALLVLGPGASGLVGQGGPVPADLVLRGGKVITVDDLDRVTDALAVRGERIVAVGSEGEIGRWIGPDTRVLDLGGRPLLPGFIDAHQHVEHTARFLYLLLDVHAPPLTSSAEVLDKVARKVADLAPLRARPGSSGRPTHPAEPGRLATSASREPHLLLERERRPRRHRQGRLLPPFSFAAPD